MEARLEKTSKSDQKIAKALRTKVTEASLEVAKAKANTYTIALSIEGHKQSLKIPKSAVQLFFKILDGMADGNSIALFLSDSKADLSTQQAADLLGVSRPHVVSLLEKGDIPFFKVGTHRRIHLKDIIAYNKRIKKNRADKLDFLAARAQELNMGY